MKNNNSQYVKIDKLPTIPQSLIELLGLSQEPDPDIHKLAQALKKDPTITARIYDAAATTHYRPWKEVQDVHRLLVVLGLESVRRIVFTCAVEYIFRQFSKSLVSQVNAIWYRSVLCACQAEELARLISFSNPHEAYLAGLLHRIGQLVLLHKHPKAYIQNIQVEGSYEQAVESEERILGVSSAHIGAELIESWKLPSFHADALRFQTLPTGRILQASPLVRILNLGQKLCCCDLEHLHTHVHDAQRIFGLTEGMLLELYTSASAGARKIVEGITGSDQATEPAQALKDSYATTLDTLSRQVKHQTLLNLLQPPGCTDTLPAYCHWVHHNISCLFGWDQLCFFFQDRGKQAWVGYDHTGRQPQLTRLQIDPDTPSAAQRALEQKAVVTWPEAATDHGAIVEAQVGRILDSDVVYYLPLIVEQEALGVVCIGCSEERNEEFQAQATFLQMLADQIAKDLKDIMQIEARTTHAPMSSEELEYNLRTTVHEINNPLSIINNYLHILSAKARDNEQILSDIDIIQSEINRVSTLVAGLRQVARPAPNALEPVDINGVIESIARFFQKSLFQSQNINTTLRLDKDLPCVLTQEHKVKQILINLLKNAAEALHSSGHLSIATRDRVFERDEIYIEMEVEDDGPGIDPDLLSVLFQPEVSTKKDHSGLGLAIVKNLVRDLEGDIRCATGAWGTRFQILVPRRIESNHQGEGK